MLPAPNRGCRVNAPSGGLPDMRAGRMLRGAADAKRIAPGRFADLASEQALHEEEIAAMRAATLATGLRDRSAVEAVAALLGVDEKTVYNMAEGRTRTNPVRAF